MAASRSRARTVLYEHGVAPGENRRAAVEPRPAARPGNTRPQEAADRVGNLRDCDRGEPVDRCQGHSVESDDVRPTGRLVISVHLLRKRHRGVLAPSLTSASIIIASRSNARTESFTESADPALSLHHREYRMGSRAGRSGSASDSGCLRRTGRASPTPELHRSRHHEGTGDTGSRALHPQ